jgi:hypothetical protein
VKFLFDYVPELVPDIAKLISTIMVMTAFSQQGKSGHADLSSSVNAVVHYIKGELRVDITGLPKAAPLLYRCI